MTSRTLFGGANASLAWGVSLTLIAAAAAQARRRRRLLPHLIVARLPPLPRRSATASSSCSVSPPCSLRRRPMTSASRAMPTTMHPKANPYPKLPDVLTMNDGTKVTTPAQWKKRRAEIKALFDKMSMARYPAHLPAVTWKVDSVEQMTVQGIPAIVKHITGHVDNSTYPAITVDIHADVVTPAGTKGTRVPVIIGGGSIRPRPVFTRPAPAPGQVVRRLASPPDCA